MKTKTMIAAVATLAIGFVIYAIAVNPPVQLIPTEVVDRPVVPPPVTPKPPQYIPR